MTRIVHYSSDRSTMPDIHTPSPEQLVDGSARVRIFAAAVPGHVMTEGTVIAYCDQPMLLIRHDDGTQSWWSTALPREVLPAQTCDSALLPPGGDPVLPCIKAGSHNEHRSADGYRWTDPLDSDAERVQISRGRVDVAPEVRAALGNELLDRLNEVERR